MSGYVSVVFMLSISSLMNVLLCLLCFYVFYQFVDEFFVMFMLYLCLCYADVEYLLIDELSVGGSEALTLHLQALHFCSQRCQRLSVETVGVKRLVEL